MEEDVAQSFIDGFLNAFPGLKEDFKKRKNQALKRGYVLIDKTTDRRWFCPYFDEMNEALSTVRSFYPQGYFKGKFKGDKKEQIKQEVYNKHPEARDLWTTYFVLKGNLERAGLNYPVQGTSGMMMKLSMNILWDMQLPNFLLTNLVHDESLAESPKELAEKYGKILGECMVKGGDYFCKSIPMKADAVIADVWIH